MKCNECTEYFYEYLNKELDKRTSDEFSAHINTCRKCREEYKLYSAYFGLSKIEDDFSVPNNLDAKIIYKLNNLKEAKKPKFQFRTRKVLTYATSFSFLFVIAVFGTNYINKITNFRDSADTNIEIKSFKDGPITDTLPSEAPTPTETVTSSAAPEPDVISSNLSEPLQTPAIEAEAAPTPKKASSSTVTNNINSKQTPDAGNKSVAPPAANKLPDPENRSAPVPLQDNDKKTVTFSDPVYDEGETANNEISAPAPAHAPLEAGEQVGISGFSINIFTDEATETNDAEVKSGGGGGASTAAASPKKSSVTHNSKAPISLKTSILEKYTNQNLGNETYKLDVSTEQIVVSFPDVNVIDEASEVIIIFES